VRVLHRMRLGARLALAFGTAYAWDVYRLGAAKAVDEKSDNRAGFLASAAKLRTLLTEVDTQTMTAAEQTGFEEMRTLWDQFFQYDGQIAALFAAGKVTEGDDLLLGKSYEIYFKIVESTNALVASVTDRATAATAKTASEARPR
jgi:methyl-accepting chemotaxis protein